MSEENKALVRRWFEEHFNAGNPDVADRLIAQDALSHDPTLPDNPPGPEGAKRAVSLYRAAFPDVYIIIEEQIAEGDKVVTRWTSRGTHQGELMGIPPSGNRVMITGININRISGGKIAENWSNYDTLGMLRQIGAIPEPG